MKVSASQIQNSFVRPQYKGQPKNVSFGKITPELISSTVNTAKKAMGLFPRSLFLANKSKGEIANAVITAAGTAFIAPLVIAFHPFSKEDKETKIYSAWRQPISAVLQFVTQLAVNVPHIRLLESTASTGKLKLLGMDMRSNPTDYYLEKMVKLKNPDLSGDALLDAIEKERAAAFRRVVEETRKNFDDKKIDFNKQPELLVAKPDYDEEISAIEDPLKKELKKLKETPEANASRIEELKAQLKDKDAISKKAMENAKQHTIEKIDANVQKKLKIKELAQKYPASVEAALEEAQRTLDAAAKDSKDAKLWGEVVDKLKDIQKYEKANKVKTPFSSLKDIGSNADEILRNVRIKQFVKAQGENAKYALQQTKLWTGIVLGLAILPASCYLLNWIYPRLMEKIMPQVVHKKHHHHEQQLPQKEMEVKA